MEEIDELRVATVIIISPVGIFGVLANLMVIYIFHKKMRSFTNLLLASISLSDIMVMISSPVISFCANRTYYNASSFEFLIRCLLITLERVSVYVSAWTMTFVAFCRYRAIVGFSHVKSDESKAFKINAVIWSGSLVIVLIFPVTELVFTFGEEHSQEFLDFMLLSVKLHMVTDLLLSYALPVIVTAFFYGSVCRVIANISKPNATQDERRREILAKKRRLVMLISLVVVFAILWLPQQILNFMGIFGVEPSIAKEWVSFVAAILYIVSCICNPIIYYNFDAHFKKNANAVLANVLSMGSKRMGAAFTQQMSSEPTASGSHDNTGQSSL